MSADFQSDSLKSVGKLLAKEREERGLSVDDVAERTRIPRRYLLAIEDGKSEYLPEPVYVRAFIRKYSDLVDLDGAALLKELQPPPPAEAPAVTPTPIERASASLTKPTLHPFHAWLLYGALVLVAAGGFSYLQRAQQPPLTARPPAPAPVVKKPAPAAKKTPSAPPVRQASPTAIKPAPVVTAPAATPESTPSLLTASTPLQTTDSVAALPKGLQMQIALKERSWVRVVADGRKAFEGELPQGTKRDWQAQKQLSVRAGNAGGVLLTLNDQSLGQMGKSGEVVERVFRQGP